MRRMCIFLSILPLLVSRVWADVTVKATDVKGLSTADRVALIRRVFEDRMEALQNATVVSETRIFSCKFQNGLVGSRVKDSGRYQFRLLRRAAAYRQESVWYVDQDTSVPKAKANAAYNDTDGITTVYGTHSDVMGQFARIDVQPFSTVDGNKAAHYLSCLSPEGGKPLLQDLLEFAATWTVDIDESKEAATITHPYHPPYAKDVKGTRVVRCDLTKGGMPTTVDVDWRRDENFWREERLVVESSFDVAGLWIPKVINERIRASTIPSECSFYRSEISSVTLGNVTNDDLAIRLPEGTEVVDIVQNTSYLVGRDGGRKNVQPLATPVTASSSEGTSSWVRYAFVLLNIGFLLLLVIVVLRRRSLQPTK